MPRPPTCARCSSAPTPRRTRRSASRPAPRDAAIKESFRLLMQLVHPDRQDAQAHWPESFAAQANRAYGILRNRESREKFDREAQARAALRGPRTGPRPHRRRRRCRSRSGRRAGNRGSGPLSGAVAARVADRWRRRIRARAPGGGRVCGADRRRRGDHRHDVSGRARGRVDPRRAGEIGSRGTRGRECSAGPGKPCCVRRQRRRIRGTRSSPPENPGAGRGGRPRWRRIVRRRAIDGRAYRGPDGTARRRFRDAWPRAGVRRRGIGGRAIGARRFGVCARSIRRRAVAGPAAARGVREERTAGDRDAARQGRAGSRARQCANRNRLGPRARGWRPRGGRRPAAARRCVDSGRAARGTPGSRRAGRAGGDAARAARAADHRRDRGAVRGIRRVVRAGPRGRVRRALRRRRRDEPPPRPRGDPRRIRRAVPPLQIGAGCS